MSLIMRRVFHYMNKFIMVPIFRLGLGSFFGNPLTGYIMVIKAIGRKTGKTRFTPVNYALFKGKIYCISGWRKTSDWYKNLITSPEIEVILPTGAVFGQVVLESDQKIRLSIIRKILKNAGFAGFMEGYNPFTISDQKLASKTDELPLICIQLLGIGNGAYDPGGWAWVWSFISMIVLIVLLVLLIK